MWRSIGLFVIIILQVSSLNNSSAVKVERESKFLVAIFEEEKWQKFQHIAVNEKNKTVYLGGINRLYQLDENLELVEQFVTGPFNISMSRFLNHDNCSNDTAPYVSIDVSNHGLLQDLQQDRLIFCSTSFKDTCYTRNLRNISSNYGNFVLNSFDDYAIYIGLICKNVSIESIIAYTSSVSFIASHPSTSHEDKVLYYAGTASDSQTFSFAGGPFSLDDRNFLKPVEGSYSMSWLGHIDVNQKEVRKFSSPVTLIYGFTSNNFTYFVSRQIDTLHYGSKMTSKLYRTCQNSTQRHSSFAQLTLECRDSEDDLFNLVLAAHKVKAGRKLASDLGIKVGEDLLFATFGSDSKNGSVLCIYDLKKINSVFLVDIRVCALGLGYSVFSRPTELGNLYIKEMRECIFTPVPDPDEAVCGVPGNTPFGGATPIPFVARFTYPTNITAIAVLSTKDLTVVFLGTSTGHLLQTVNGEFVYRNISINKDSPIIQDMLFDKGRDHLYVAAANKVCKVLISNCSLYGDRDACTTSQDPFCGWCHPEGKCSLKSECSHNHPNSWTRSTESNHPQTTDVTYISASN